MLWKIAVGCAIVGAILASLIGNAIWSAKLARCEATHAKEIRDLSRSTAERLAHAQRVTAEVTAEFEHQRRLADEKEQRLLRQIARLRAVHVSPEHRVLINEAIIHTPTHHVSPTASEPTAHPTGPPAPPPAVGTDGTDNLAEWAVLAASMYRSCQEQIRGLKAWSDGVFSHTPPTDGSSEPTSTPPPRR